MKIILDTNLWISFVIGKKLSVMRALFSTPEILTYKEFTAIRVP